MTSPQQKGRLMPDYNTIEWEGLEIKGLGTGWGRVPKLRKLPIFSGGRHSFRIQIRAKDKERKMNIVTAKSYCHGPGGGSLDEVGVERKASLKKKVTLGLRLTE